MHGSVRELSNIEFACNEIVGVAVTTEVQL